MCRVGAVGIQVEISSSQPRHMAWGLAGGDACVHHAHVFLFFQGTARLPFPPPCCIMLCLAHGRQAEGMCDTCEVWPQGIFTLSECAASRGGEGGEGAWGGLQTVLSLRHREEGVGESLQPLAALSMQLKAEISFVTQVKPVTAAHRSIR